MKPHVTDLLQRCGIAAGAEGAIDVAAWVGQYPFRGIARSGVADWDELASSLGIAGAIVAPYEAVFQENGLDAYAAWAERLSEQSRLEVWPVVRPGAVLGLEELLDRFHPRGLRLVPSYHGFQMHDAAVEPIMRMARQRGMVVQIFTRLADERWHWMLKVPELSSCDIDYATAVYDRQPILVSGLNSPQSLSGRMTQHPMLYADVSRVRGPVFAIEQLVKSAPSDRLVFGSLWPMQIVEATLWQVTSAKITPPEREGILWRNAECLLKQRPGRSGAGKEAL